MNVRGLAGFQKEGERAGSDSSSKKESERLLQLRICKHWKMQRRLAWPLGKDDMQTQETFHIFLR